MCCCRLCLCLFPCLWLRFSSKVAWWWSCIGSVQSDVEETRNSDRLLLLWLSLPFLSCSFVTVLSLTLPLPRLREGVTAVSSFNVHKQKHSVFKLFNLDLLKKNQFKVLTCVTMIEMSGGFISWWVFQIKTRCPAAFCHNRILHCYILHLVCVCV